MNQPVWKVLHYTSAESFRAKLRRDGFNDKQVESIMDASDLDVALALNAKYSEEIAEKQEPLYTEVCVRGIKGYLLAIPDSFHNAMQNTPRGLAVDFELTNGNTAVLAKEDIVLIIHPKEWIDKMQKAKEEQQ